MSLIASGWLEESNSAFSTFFRLNAMQGIEGRVNAPASKRSNSENGHDAGEPQRSLDDRHRMCSCTSRLSLLDVVKPAGHSWSKIRKFQEGKPQIETTRCRATCR